MTFKSKVALALTSIDKKKEEQALRDAVRGTTGTFRQVDIEEDDLGISNSPTNVDTGAAPVVQLPDIPGLYWPKLVFVASIREIYPRKEGRQGSRIVFNTGTFMLVKESYTDIMKMLADTPPRNRSRTGLQAAAATATAADASEADEASDAA